MNITDKIDKYLNEAGYEIGDWIKQTGSDFISYAIIVNKQKNGGYKVVKFTSYDGSMAGKAKIASSTGWHPSPVEISENDVPKKIKDKIMDKAGKYL